MGELIPLLRHLEQSRFYGSVELKYEAGRVVLIRKSETFIVTGEGACNTVLFRPSSTASCVNKQARAIASSSCRPSIPSFMSRSQTTWSLVMVARFLSKHPIDSRVPAMKAHFTNGNVAQANLSDLPHMRRGPCSLWEVALTNSAKRYLSH
jgi:hypothetical protein